MPCVQQASSDQIREDWLLAIHVTEEIKSEEGSKRLLALMDGEAGFAEVNEQVFLEAILDLASNDLLVVVKAWALLLCLCR